ncbi:FtsX-like permease family protein [Microbacterium sp. gxy059]|uniref:FtsX-like permease family protein n=1 Tax=Microbacterium sp. gxy059 TaxID=2957199 RepID=UPI003D950DBD
MSAETRGSFLRERGMGASVLVAALSSAFGAVLLSTTGYLGFLARESMGDGGSVVLVVGIMSVIFLIIAMYVGAVVTANTFSTIVAGRTRQIALMRLIGATARSERGRVATQGLVVGVLGSAVGVVVGTALSFGGAALASRLIDAPAYREVLQPWLALPFVAVALTTWVAAWAGSRRVLQVTPLEALGGSVERPHSEVASRGRRVSSTVLAVLGVLLIVAGIVVGLASSVGVVIAFLGGILSFTALVLGATTVMPPVLRLVGRAFGRSATARLAAENGLRYPERSSRMAIGVVIGVTLVTMFAVATESAKAVFFQGLTAEEIEAHGVGAFLDGFSGIMMALVAFSAVIAGIGLVNLLTIGVVQRRTELGLLRALGLSSGQVRRVVLLEAAHITLSATLLGLALGIAYGWAGAQSLLASLGEGGVFLAPAVPWLPVTIVVAAMALLTLVAAVAPTRLATRVSPVEALAAA